VSERVLAQFLAELDGVEELKGVLVLGATNRPDIIDPAVLRPGRFDEVVEIPMPDEQQRREIFEVHLRGKPLVSGIDVGKLAALAKGLSGADIAGVCHQAALAAVRRVVKAAGENPPDESALRITAKDIRVAIDAARTFGGEAPSDEAEA
jgi:transitional endoplasmic reticulum ATPase